jgi:type II secretory pathway pseudopilin PulG
MVKFRRPKSEGRMKAEDGNTDAGALLIELLVAIALLAGALLPLAYSFSSEKRYARALYQRAIAMEIVDGEIEALAAGQWRAFTNGVQEYPVHAGAATNLPPGRFVLTLQASKVRLEWQPAVKHHGGPVVREAAK